MMRCTVQEMTQLPVEIRVCCGGDGIVYVYSELSCILSPRPLHATSECCSFIVN
jgi:hypothetical protein